MPRKPALFASLFLLLLATVLFAAAQDETAPTQRRTTESRQERREATLRDAQFQQQRNQQEPLEERMERTRMKSYNKDRYNDMKKSTDRLLELANELKTHVDKADENVLSVDVIKKAEEVEKLAKDVRKKMQAYYTPAHELRPRGRD